MRDSVVESNILEGGVQSQWRMQGGVFLRQLSIIGSRSIAFPPSQRKGPQRLSSMHTLLLSVKYPRTTGRTISDFQWLMSRTYLTRDRVGGIHWALKRLNGEVKELEDALRNGQREAVSAELADVFAWLTSMSNLLGVDLEAASYQKYRNGCSKCSHIPCSCAPEFR